MTAAPKNCVNNKGECETTERGDEDFGARNSLGLIASVVGGVARPTRRESEY